MIELLSFISVYLRKCAFKWKPIPLIKFSFFKRCQWTQTLYKTKFWKYCSKMGGNYGNWTNRGQYHTPEKSTMADQNICMKTSLVQSHQNQGSILWQSIYFFVAMSLQLYSYPLFQQSNSSLNNRQDNRKWHMVFQCLCTQNNLRFFTSFTDLLWS